MSSLVFCKHGRRKRQPCRISDTLPKRCTGSARKRFRKCEVQHGCVHILPCSESTISSLAVMAAAKAWCPRVSGRKVHATTTWTPARMRVGRGGGGRRGDMRLRDQALPQARLQTGVRGAQHAAGPGAAPHRRSPRCRQHSRHPGASHQRPLPRPATAAKLSLHLGTRGLAIDSGTFKHTTSDARMTLISDVSGNDVAKTLGECPLLRMSWCHYRAVAVHGHALSIPGTECIWTQPVSVCTTCWS